MHARVQIVRTLPPPMQSADAKARFIEALESQPGFRGAHLLVQIGSRRGLSLTLWETLTDAEAAPERTEAVLGPRPFPLAVDDVYDVWDTAYGSSRPEQATVAKVSWFDGPRSAAQTEAARRAGEERIKPAVEGIGGLVMTYVLGRPQDSATVVFELATSIDTFDRVADAVFGTALLPGEDPVLLTGPDRVELYRLDGQSLPAASVR